MLEWKESNKINWSSELLPDHWPNIILQAIVIRWYRFFFFEMPSYGWWTWKWQHCTKTDTHLHNQKKKRIPMVSKCNCMDKCFRLLCLSLLIFDENCIFNDEISHDCINDTMNGSRVHSCVKFSHSQLECFVCDYKRIL